MAAGNWQIYNEFKKSKAYGTLDLDGHTFYMALFQHVELRRRCAGDRAVRHATNQHAGNNGYTTGGHRQ